MGQELRQSMRVYSSAALQRPGRLAESIFSTLHDSNMSAMTRMTPRL
jgi:hypothetical protein